MKNRKLVGLWKCNGYDGCKSMMYLSPFVRARTVFKYMDLETAIICLSENNLRFSEPVKWEDGYEARFYTADYSNVCTNNKITPKLYACCFTRKKASEAAWKTYSYNKTGLGCRCVQFKLNLQKLRLQLNSFASTNGFFVYESQMNYDLSDEKLKVLHKKRNSLYGEYFRNFTFASYLSLLSLKRQAFDYEDEVRYFLIPKKNSINEDGIMSVNIAWKDLIEEILIDSEVSEIEEMILKSYCQKTGLKISHGDGNHVEIKRVKLYEAPKGRVIIE